MRPHTPFAGCRFFASKKPLVPEKKPVTTRPRKGAHTKKKRAFINPNPNETEPPLMRKMIELVQGLVDTPLCIDSSVPAALEAGLRAAHGRPLLNSVTGEEELDISDLVAFYREAKVRFDGDEAFQDKSRKAVVALQAGDEASLAAWKLLCAQSEKAFNKVYELLSVDERLNTRGESFYNNKLGETVEALKEGSLLKESDGAQAVCPFNCTADLADATVYIKDSYDPNAPQSDRVKDGLDQVRDVKETWERTKSDGVSCWVFAKHHCTLVI